jgi:hypothetical protein
VRPATGQLATPSEVNPFSYWSSKPWYLTEGKFVDVSSHLPLGVSQPLPQQPLPRFSGAITGAPSGGDCRVWPPGEDAPWSKPSPHQMQTSTPTHAPRRIPDPTSIEGRGGAVVPAKTGVEAEGQSSSTS